MLAKAQRLQVLCGLKQVIRYDEDRPATDSTESVAGHVYGLQILARYLLPLESLETTLDERAVERLILWHDSTEVLVGDVMGHKKIDAQRTAEIAAAE